LNLILDIGNTRTKIGVFSGHRLLKKMIWNQWTLRHVKELIEQKNINRVALSSVSDPKKSADNFFKKHFYYINLNANTALPIKNHYKTPQTLGKDRLAAVVGAFAEYPNQHNLVIDAGTCIKYDLITADGDYYGGSISPGIEMRLKAMHHFTAKLPLVKRGNLRTLVGKNTKTALQTGGQLGAIAEAIGFISWYKEKYGQINVILTGGDANFFAKKLKTPIFVNQNLVLTGLNKILNYNVELSE